MNRKTCLILIILLTLPLCLKTSPVSAVETASITLYPIADSYVDSESPTTNYGGYSWIEVQSIEWFEGKWYCIIFLKFDLPKIKGEITSAVLKLRTLVVDESTDVGISYCPDNSWTEYGITFLNCPMENLTPIGLMYVSSEFTWYSWDVTDCVAGNTSNVISFLLMSMEHWVGFYSKEGATGALEEYKPKLEIIYEKPFFETTVGIATLVGVPIIVIVVVVVFFFRRRKPTTKPEIQPDSNISQAYPYN